MDFKPFGDTVLENVRLMGERELYVVDIDHNELWQAYLAAFPEGSNPIYVTRTEHDCVCCRNFVKNYGNVVAMDGQNWLTVWDDHADKLEYPYSVVAERMRSLVMRQKIMDVFRSDQRSYGNASTRQSIGEFKAIKTWDHFWGPVFTRHFTFTPAKDRGEIRTSVQVLKRGLDELKTSALQDVLDLINGNSLYRGAEFAHSVMEFMQHKLAYSELTDTRAQDQFVWANARSQSARFINTSIGTLANDLSNGVPIEDAVRMFESKVAPQNYKRTSSLITPRMVQTAMSKIQELNLEPALQRRYARMSDITVNNVLWADSGAKRRMKSPLENALMDAAVIKPSKTLETSSIGISEFLEDVLPNTTELEMLVNAQHHANFVSLTAPVHSDVVPLFKWNNNFAWSYDGNVTDSIRERVKKAGGNVTNAAMRVSLAWFNYDDLDIHVFEPNGNEISFRDKQGKLDVDMNALTGRTREPVENVSWRPGQLQNGAYKVTVHQFQPRETKDYGFQIEIENNGRFYQLSYAPVVKHYVDACVIHVKNGLITEIVPGRNVVGGGFSQERWGIMTETFVRVETMLLSPNHWDGQHIGNKHYIFALEGCKNPESTRGIYNEFLRADLEEHRKVFEIVGDRTKCPPSDDQISGLGFSSTRGDVVTVRATLGRKDGRKVNYTINF